ncbi:Jjj1p PWA37_003254 [Arxiozyma heterogenica]|uniref:Jjj1p n=1 Tax=Arxiozyma heterogenica TaxID=278026 RepID=UPI002EFC1906
MKVCYYELLGVSRDATDIDLKKAYHKKALQYHPDKNPDNIEEATEIFSNIRTAYEVLSDPQERAWYDDHREQILNDSMNIDDVDNDQYEFDSSITGVTTDELLMFFNGSLYTKLDNSPAGMYQIVGKIFAKLAMDEVNWWRRISTNESNNQYKDDIFEKEIQSVGYLNAVEDRLSDDRYMFPTFGHSRTDYQYLKQFYRKWSNFNTFKNFSWKDEYMYSSQYDRRTKREIKKRNDRARNNAKNEYIKTVKRFVTFIKKLDKRMQRGAAKEEEERKLKEKQQRDMLKKQIQQQKRDISQKSEFEVQNWQTNEDVNWDELAKTYDEQKDYYKSSKEAKTTNKLNAWKKSDRNKNDTQYGDIDDNDTDTILIYECNICNKTFKSEKQLDNHINTKLHRKNVYRLQKEVSNENMSLGLDNLSELEEYDSAKENQEEEASINISTSISQDIQNMNMKQLNEQLAEIERQLAEADFSDDYNSEDADEEEKKEEELVVTEFAEEVKKHYGEEKSMYSNESNSTHIEDSGFENEDVFESEEEIDELTKILKSLEERNCKDSGIKFGDENQDNDSSDEDWCINKNNKKKKKKQKGKGKNKKKSNNENNSMMNTDDLNNVDNVVKGHIPQWKLETCATCGQTFGSKNQLFNHVKEKDHAASPNKVKKSTKKKNKKKQK